MNNWTISSWNGSIGAEINWAFVLCIVKFANTGCRVNIFGKIHIHLSNQSKVCGENWIVQCKTNPMIRGIIVNGSASNKSCYSESLCHTIYPYIYAIQHIHVPTGKYMIPCAGYITRLGGSGGKQHVGILTRLSHQSDITIVALHVNRVSNAPIITT